MTARRPEDDARATIDAALEAAGWVVQDEAEMQLGAGLGVAVREFPMAPGHGFADYLLFIDRRAVGTLEAKKAEHTLIGVENQVRLYSDGLPAHMAAPVKPLPFLYVSNGIQLRFTNLLDPHPRSRTVFAPHRPETLAEWLEADSLEEWVHRLPQPITAEVQTGWLEEPRQTVYRTGRPSSLRGRLSKLPPVGELPGLWPHQRRAIENLETSLRQDRPRALIQMVMGSGKSRLAVAAIYRLIKLGGVRRVLFLVDRRNLAMQAEDEFASYRTYDDHRKFTELYNVQRLGSNHISSSAKVVITTIQRLYSILRGEEELAPELEDDSAFEKPFDGPVPTVDYRAALPPEYFDLIVIDECHRSIYTLWGQVLEYFDAYLVGLTATPAKHTFGFFHRNLVMEYSHGEAVADGVNVDFDIYRIRTRITEEGSEIEAGPGVVLRHRERRTRAERWEVPDDDISYTAHQLDRQVVAKDQIRLVARTFQERLFTEIFPGREQVPKTLVFAKDDSHAEDIVEIFREEFGRGNQFCTKITYRSTGKKPEELIRDFRTSYFPRIAVSVDMISTGVDVKPIEIVMFLRSVKSRQLYDQMLGRGTRVIRPDDLRAVTPDAHAKTHFVLVDCVGVTESPRTDTRPLDQKRSLSFAKLLRQVSHGSTDPEMLRSLAGRLGRLDRQLADDDRRRIAEVSEGHTVSGISRGLVDALDPDHQREAARDRFELGPGEEPTEAQVAAAAEGLIREAAAPLADNQRLRNLLIEIHRRFDQILDEVSLDELLEAAPAPRSRERARELVRSFEHYLEEHKDEIDALQFFYSAPYGQRLRYSDIRALADAIGAPPRNWTPEALWRAYGQLDHDRVRGGGGQRLLADIVSLVRFALHQEDELVPYGEQVRQRFATWLAQQRTAGNTFTPEQLRWLEMIRDHVARSLEIEREDFDLTPFVEEGGLGRAAAVFEGRLDEVLRELNEVLAA